MNRKITLDDIKPGFVYKDKENFLLILREENNNEVIVYCLNRCIILDFTLWKINIVNYVNNKEIIYVK